jgi:AcrR family transcriptional regulator
LYRRLPHGPHGMCHEEVERNQRTRIYGAMIEAVWRHGYRDTRVTDVVALAGVSRRAFYEHFPNKDACFLATFDLAVARERRRVIDAWEAQHGWPNRMHAACKSLLDGTAADPRAAHLILVEAPAVRSSAAGRMQLAAAAFERLIATAYSLAPDRRLPSLVPRAITGGISHIILRRLLERCEHELRGLTGEVLDWIESYHSAAAPPTTTATSARRRDPGALVHTGAVPREPSPFEMLIAHALDATRDSLYGAPTWPQAVHGSVAGFVARLLANPALLDRAAREPLANARTIAGLEELARVLSVNAPPARRGPAIAEEALAGGLWAIISSHATPARLVRLPAAVDHLAFTLLAPHLGARGASEAIRSVCASPPRVDAASDERPAPARS